MLTKTQSSQDLSPSASAVQESVPGPYSVTRLKFTDIDSQFIQEWSSLCNRSAEPNAFLSPEFLIPASNFLVPGERPRLMCVRDEKNLLVGFAAFHGVAVSRKLPLPHLKTFQTMHSFRGGFLMDAAQVQPATEALVDALADDGWFAIEFAYQWLDSPIIDALKIACHEKKYTWSEEYEEFRPGFSPTKVDDQYFQINWSKNRRKSARKNIKRLEKLGDWRVRVVTNGSEFDRAINRFLDLEHAGWKAGTGTSMRSKGPQERFFTTMMRNFSETNTAFFAELLLDDQVIGSSANLISGDTAFAFKIGWDPEFAKVSPGTILESELIRRSPETLSHINFVDSCSSSDSYVAGIWPEKMRVGSGLLTLRRSSRWIASGFDQIKVIKRHVLG